MPLKSIWVLTWDILMVITIKIRSTNGTKENCTFVFESRNAKFGNFSTPSWPSMYPNNLRCIYYFRGEPFEAINITFLVFDLESPFPKGCLSDYIDISTITAFNVKRLVGRYCGSSVPSPLLSMHPRSEIIFKSNHVISKQGFFGFYQFVDEGLIGPPIRHDKVDCGGEEKGSGGVISSPNYPNSFPKSVDCMWLIRVQQNQHIYLRIMQLQLFGSIANCKDAHLAIYDGYENFDYEHHEPKKYCGDLKYYKSLDDKVQLSANNRLLIRFKSDIAAPQWEEQVATQEITGFKLIWTAITFKPKGECKDFLCSKSEFCLIPTRGSTCQRKEFFCIDKSLKCDGIPNCSEQDSSDEDQCNVPNRLYLIVSLFGVIFILLIATCLLCNRRSRSKCYRDSSMQSDLHHGSQSSAFTLKTTSDGSISVKHLNHSPQSSSYVIISDQQQTSSSPLTLQHGQQKHLDKQPTELLIPLDTFYHQQNYHHQHHQKHNYHPLPMDNESFLPSSSVVNDHYHTGSLRTPRHLSTSSKQNVSSSLVTNKPLSSASLGNILISTTPTPTSLTAATLDKVSKCSIHGHGSIKVPPSLSQHSHQHDIRYNNFNPRDDNSNISIFNLKS